MGSNLQLTSIPSKERRGTPSVVALRYSLYLLELYKELHTYIAFLLTLELDHGLFHQWMLLAPLEGYEVLMIHVLEGLGVVLHL